jgi:fucose permease
MTQTAEVREPVPSRLPLISIMLPFVAFVLMGANDGAIGVLLPEIRIFYHIDDATLAWIFLASTLGYLSATLNNGLLTTRLGLRRFLLLAMLLVAVGAGLISGRLPFVLYLGSVYMLGFGVGMLDAGLNAFIASLPGNVTLLNYLHAFYGVGALLGPLVASTLLAWQLGWQTIYLVWLGVAFLILAGFWLAFRVVARADQEPKKGEDASAGRNNLLHIMRLRIVWLAASFLFIYVGVEISMSSWGYSYLLTARQGPALFSAWIISGYWCGLTLGRLTLAHLSKRLGARHLITLCLCGIGCSLALGWFLPGIVGAAIGFCLTGFFLGPLFPTVIALMPQLVAPRLLAGAIGFLASLASVGGALLPSLVGNLFQHIGFWVLLPFVFILTLGMAVSWFWLQRSRSGPVAVGQ